MDAEVKIFKRLYLGLSMEEALILKRIACEASEKSILEDESDILNKFVEIVVDFLDD